ncbi:hypothetical protein EJB05_49873, partial [Eragrostis curvula]
MAAAAPVQALKLRPSSISLRGRTVASFDVERRATAAPSFVQPEAGPSGVFRGRDAAVAAACQVLPDQIRAVLPLGGRGHTNLLGHRSAGLLTHVQYLNPNTNYHPVIEITAGYQGSQPHD